MDEQHLVSTVLKKKKNQHNNKNKANTPPGPSHIRRIRLQAGGTSAEGIRYGMHRAVLPTSLAKWYKRIWIKEDYSRLYHQTQFESGSIWIEACAESTDFWDCSKNM
eukprot:2026480-Ditylum_brightwellii.AAC.1